MKKLLFLLISVTLVACSAKVSTRITRTVPPLDYTEEVTVLSIMDEIPLHAIEIGTVKIGDNGISTNCGWDVVIEKAKMEARKAGGNVLKITRHIPPSIMGSSCDRITALILKVENPEELNILKKNDQKIADSTWEYAKLFVYRSGGSGAFIGYDLYLGDSLLCRVKNNSRQEIIITQKGMNSLWAKTESVAAIPIDIEFGKEYYLKCSIKMGIVVGRPRLQLVDKMQGISEYSTIKSRN